MNRNTQLRVLVGDDHALVVEGFRQLLEPGYLVAGAAFNGRALVGEAERLRPDIVLVDISMPELNGIEATRQIKKKLPKTKIIIVTMHSDATFLVEALRAGASGYVLMHSSPDQLLEAIEASLKGEVYVSPSAAKEVGQERLAKLSKGKLNEPYQTLTARQREVLQLIAEGKSMKEIADKLCVAPKTVEFHKYAIQETLGLRTTAELVRYAVRHGIVPA